MKIYYSLQHKKGTSSCHWWDRTKADAMATHQSMAEQVAAEGHDGHVVTYKVDYPMNARAIIELGNGLGVEFAAEHKEIERELIKQTNIDSDDMDRDEEIEVEIEEEDDDDAGT